MRILITGTAGQLGMELRRILESGYAEIGSAPEAFSDAEVVYTDSEELNIADSRAVESFIEDGAFDLAINCAALTSVDWCELNPEEVFSVNALGAENVARATARQSIPVVYVSTDYVFSGVETTERIEDDPIAPASVYGKSKAEGERLVAAANPKHHIIRSAWLYGYTGKNFVKTIRRLAAKNDEITVVDDQFGNPTNANDLAYEILKISLTDYYGIWHVTNNGTCSWADFAKAIMEGSGLDCEVVPVTSEQYKQANPQSANRPAFSSLKNKRLQDTIGDEMRPWREALAEYLRRLPELEG